MDIRFIVISTLLMIADGFTLRGPAGPLVVPLGSSVVLPCYVDEPLLTEDLEVKWERTDSETLVHLYMDGESRPEVQDQDYHDRAHFFTDQIQNGNFSLRLDNLTAEDEGKYTCKVYSQQDSGETVVQIYVERLLVSGSNRSISAYDGEDVTLNCSVDSHITPERFEEVKWTRIDEDILVLLYQDNESFPDSSDEQYRDRVEFFTDEMRKGNFSLRLKSVRTEDKGVYMCQVFAGGLSANATVVLEQLGFSFWHTTVLVFCFVAGSGSVLLLCCLIYCRSKNAVSSRTIWNLQISLVFFPNICMSIAFLFWGLTEGFLHETVTCCALYILRPVMLIWVLPCLKYLQDNIKTWIRFFRITSEFVVFTIIVYSVLYAYGWRKRAHDTSIIPRVVSGIFFGLVVLFCLILTEVDFKRLSSQEQTGEASFRSKTQKILSMDIFFLSWSQLFQMIYSFGVLFLAFLFMPFVPLLLVFCLKVLPRLHSKFKCLRRRLIRLLCIITIRLLDIILLIYIHLTILEKEKDYLGWTFVIVFIEVLKMMVTFEKNSVPVLLCNEIMYMFGAVGLVLLTSVTLTAELILKARNGERVLKDLRVIVFPSECVFAFYWLVLLIHAFWKIVTTESTNNQRNSDQIQTSAQEHSIRDSDEMENLSAADPAVSQTQE